MREGRCAHAWSEYWSEAGLEAGPCLGHWGWWLRDCTSLSRIASSRRDTVTNTSQQQPAQTHSSHRSDGQNNSWSELKSWNADLTRLAVSWLHFPPRPSDSCRATENEREEVKWETDKVQRDCGERVLLSRGSGCPLSGWTKAKKCQKPSLPPPRETRGQWLAGERQG